MFVAIFRILLVRIRPNELLIFKHIESGDSGAVGSGGRRCSAREEPNPDEGPEITFIISDRSSEMCLPRSEMRPSMINLYICLSSCFSCCCFARWVSPVSPSLIDIDYIYIVFRSPHVLFQCITCLHSAPGRRDKEPGYHTAFVPRRYAERFLT